MDLISAPILSEYEDRFLERSFASLDGGGDKLALYPEYEWDPVGFARDILGVELWICQREICDLVVENPEVSVRACYASGKTFLAACLALWWLWTRPVCLVVSTAPTARQVEELLWAEINDLHSSAKRPLGGTILSRKARLDGKRKAFGVVGDAKNKSTKAGYHSKAGKVLFLVDEAAGMKSGQMDGFRGLLVDPEECRSLEIGNPVSTEGPFYEDHVYKRSQSKKLYAISALRTPNLTGEGEEARRYPGLVSQAYVNKVLADLGPKHPLFVTTILAEFVRDEHGQVTVPESWAIAAGQRWAERFEDEPEINYLSADVAGHGQNENVLYQRKGRRIFKVDSWIGADVAEGDESGQRGTMLTARRIIEWAEKVGATRLLVDSQGLGIGICDRIAEFQDAGRAPKCRFYPVATGESATGPTANRYHRQIDQLQWAMREAFDPDGPAPVAIEPTDTDLIKQLPWRRWSLIGDGEDNARIKVSRKRDLISEGKPSPDSADAVSLLFFEPEEVEGDVFFV